MILEYNGNAVTITTKYDYPHTREIEKVQAVERSGAGLTHVEDYNVLTNRYTYKYFEIPTAEYELLFNFFNDHARGMYNVFNLTDDFGVQRAVRFVQPRLKFALVFNGLWSGSFTVEAQGSGG